MVSVRVDGLMVVSALAIGAGLYAYSQKEKIKDSIQTDFNPNSNENIIYKSTPVQSVVNHQLADGYSVADKYFAYVDFINPFNESDKYANKVWGLK